MKAGRKATKRAGRRTSSSAQARRTGRDADFARCKSIAAKLDRVAPKEDNAIIAGAIVLFASEVILRSSKDVREARAYLDGMRTAIDKLIGQAFPKNDAQT